MTTNIRPALHTRVRLIPGLFLPRRPLLPLSLLIPQYKHHGACLYHLCIQQFTFPSFAQHIKMPASLRQRATQECRFPSVLSGLARDGDFVSLIIAVFVLKRDVNPSQPTNQPLEILTDAVAVDLYRFLRTLLCIHKAHSFVVWEPKVKCPSRTHSQWMVHSL